MSNDTSKGSAAEKPPRVGCLSRWAYILVVGVVIFSFGAGSIYLLFYQPAAEENRTLTADLEAARAELQDLRPLVAENETLEAEVTRAGLRLMVLTALVDVNAARVYLALGESQPAADGVATIEEGLMRLMQELDGPRADAVGAMLDRLALVQDEIAADAFAAQSDLEVLANDLSQLAAELEAD